MHGVHELHPATKNIEARAPRFMTTMGLYEWDNKNTNLRTPYREVATSSNRGNRLGIVGKKAVRQVDDSERGAAEG